MIGYLSGKFVDEDNGTCLILTHGVGYEVSITLRDAHQLQTNQEIQVYTHFVVREDAQQLYGFLNRNDRDVFRILLKANQVGPKLALVILDTYTYGELYQLIVDERLDLMRRIKGIGPKMAERLMVQIKGFLQDFPTVSHTTTQTTSTDAMQALLSLGYKESHIQTVLRDIHETDTSTVIKLALSRLSNKETT